MTGGEWKTVRDNFIAALMLKDMAQSHRVIFSDEGDIAYVAPFDGDNGNKWAAIISASPKLYAAVKAAEINERYARVAGHGNMPDDLLALLTAALAAARGGEKE